MNKDSMYYKITNEIHKQSKVCCEEHHTAPTLQTVLKGVLIKFSPKGYYETLNEEGADLYFSAYIGLEVLYKWYAGFDFTIDKDQVDDFTIEVDL